ncbi:MAG: peptidyl-prolyl cis-trans isomerase [Rhodothermia bacterium]|nr:peptidyl-prolyl cis-trans isomerase [Rhodothermia bacterium]
MLTSLRTRILFLCVSILGVAVLGCEEPVVDEDYVARVGPSLLLRSDIEEALSSLPPGRDSTEAVEQIVEQWVVNTLLEHEARESGLLGEPDVQRLLEENERSVLVSAYIEKVYDENPVEPTPEEVNRFFELNRDRLRLREPYVRVRYLSNASRDSVRAARQELQRAMRSAASVDSVWLGIAERYASDAEASKALGSNYFAESRLFASVPRIRDAVTVMAARQLSQVVEDNGDHHFVQVVDRVPAGTVPRIGWIEDEISRQLILEQRKQTVARTVQNLRNLAVARNLLEIRLQEAEEEQAAQ